MSYHRVIPRDFFNEAKLLKCLGRLQLLILDGKLSLTSDYDGEPFDIQQNDNDGSIYVANYHVFCGEILVHFYTPLNSREEWPLMAEFGDSTFYVFGKDGSYLPAWGRAEFLHAK